jgi:hypothetical protein
VRAIGAFLAAAGGAAVFVAAGFAVAAPGAQAASSSAPCVVSLSAPQCQSSNPELTVDAVFGSDSTACTFSYSINWGDGSRVQQVTFKGLASGETSVATHSYQGDRVQPYQVVASVVNVTGNCKAVAGNYTFTLLAGGAAAPSASATGTGATTGASAAATPGATTATPAGADTSAAPAATPAGAPATGGGTGPGASVALAAGGGAIMAFGAGLVLLARRRRGRSA